MQQNTNVTNNAPMPPVNPIGNNLPINLNLTLEEVNLILVGLGELKHSIVAPLVDKIRFQGDSQVIAQQKAEKTDNKLLDSLMKKI